MKHLTDTKGITSTSAEYLANVGKESIKNLESKLDKYSLLKVEIELINGEKKLLNKGSNQVDLESCLKQIANIHAFCAWVREAIKEKNDLISKLSELSLEEYCCIIETELPLTPNSPKTVTETDIISEMNVKELNTYLTLEAFASTFGKYIHPGGDISNARINLLEKEQESAMLIGSGRDAVIYTYTPNISSKEFDKIYMNLQSQYRDYERKLNSIKYNIKEEVHQRNLKINFEYNKEYRDYVDKMKLLHQQMNEYIISETERISKLKIIIPEKLTDTYLYLESLGKKEN